MSTDPRQNGGLTAINGAMMLIVVLLIVQIWLLSATLESYLAGRHQAALPGAIISGLLFAACVGLYLFVNRIDSEVADESRHHQSAELLQRDIGERNVAGAQINRAPE